MIEGQYLRRGTILKLNAPFNAGTCLKVDELLKIIKLENNSEIKGTLLPAINSNEDQIAWMLPQYCIQLTIECKIPVYFHELKRSVKDEREANDN